jgi:hypothetical protein
MPRAVSRTIKLRFNARAHGLDQWATQRALGLLGLTRMGPRHAIIQAQNRLGTYKASIDVFDSLPRKHGRPRRQALQGAIRHLRLIFATHYVGPKWGRAKNEFEFIQLCLEESGLVGDGFDGLRYHLRTIVGYALPPAIWRGGYGRQDAIEMIADNSEKARENAGIGFVPFPP